MAGLRRNHIVIIARKKRQLPPSPLVVRFWWAFALTDRLLPGGRLIASMASLGAAMGGRIAIG